MVQTQNSRLQEALRRATRVNSMSLPQDLRSDIQATVECNPDLVAEGTVFNASVTSTGSGTVVPAVAGNSFVIKGYTLCLLKDATCDTADGLFNITFVQGGITKSLAILPLLTLTAQEATVSCTLLNPITVDVGTAVSVSSNTFTVGKMRRICHVYGYFISNTNA